MIGDFTPGKTVVCRFNTHKADGTPVTLDGTPAISVYKNSTTESTAGVTLTVDYDSRTGMHLIAIDTSSDGTFYAAGNDFDLVITAGTVDSISVVGTVVGTFSLSNRAALRPTTADRTLDVSSGGEAGIDWANVGSPTTTLNLSGTTVKTATDVATDVTTLLSRLVGTIATGTHNPQSGDTYGIVNNGTYGNSALKTLIDSLSTSVTNLNNLAALANLRGPAVMEIPESSTKVYKFILVIADQEGKLTDLDSSPTLAAANAAGTDRSANLSSVTHDSTGRYSFTYTVSAGDTEESVIISATGAVSAETRFAVTSVSVVDYDSVSTINTILTNLNNLVTTISNGITISGTKTTLDDLNDFDPATDTVDIGKINGSTSAATRLALSANAIVPGTVDATAFTPTTTQFEADDITEATDSHYNGRLIIFTSSNLLAQATSITAYTLTGGRGHFTVVAMTEAPADDSTFIII